MGNIVISLAFVPSVMKTTYTDEIEHQRQRKDEYFASDPHSPIAPEQRDEAFPGLDYYPPDPDLRFELDLHEHDEKETITVETTAEGRRDYLRWGEFRFEVEGEEVTIQAYKAAPDDDHLWVPFRDATSGDETYGAGRYIDLLDEHHRTPDGRWILDFNLAYNPTCAYNEAYECPLIPMENWLEVPIHAGERDYPGEPASAHHHNH